ncbi:MAG: O-antigen ligase family protein [Actinobacteria bacterium]|nr:O-antigen ligase family protein [Actinomycetota bacterium]
MTTVVVIWGSVTDPVNTPKLFILGTCSFAAGAIAFLMGFKEIWRSSRLWLIGSILFIAFSISAVLNSPSPLEQNIYGTYGRNTGFITYFALLLISTASTLLRQKSNFNLLVYSLFAAGATNVAYCLWAIAFGDFIGWNNPYGNILGTFGNPNFIGAFLGIFITALTAYVLQPGISWKYRGLALIIVAIGLFEILKSHAVQGLVVSAAGFSIIGFHLIRSKFHSKVILAGYTLVIALLGFIALMGALQKGPLTAFIYKESVTLRGEYWQAGWNMASQFPFTGVGMDSYGDWYRRVRDSQALIVPGPEVVTNAAHNIPFDILAYGGWPLFLSFIFLISLAAISIIKVTLRNRNYDGTFIALSVAWTCYQIQSVISISQIGLAIWGWLLSGAVIAYEIATRDSGVSEKKISSGKSAKSKEQILSATTIGGLGLVIGALIVVPPLSADMKWKSAITKGDLTMVKAALVPSYMTPTDTNRLLNMVSILENSKLPDIAYEYAKKAVEFNPESFDSWRTLYLVTNSTPQDKELALTNMKRLDPKNSNVLNTPK